MGGMQLGFSDYEQTTPKKWTNREQFLTEIEAVVPWQAVLEFIALHYPISSKKAGQPPSPWP